MHLYAYIPGQSSCLDSSDQTCPTHSIYDMEEILGSRNAVAYHPVMLLLVLGMKYHVSHPEVGTLSFALKSFWGFIKVICCDPKIMVK